MNVERSFNPSKQYKKWHEPRKVFQLDPNLHYETIALAYSKEIHINNNGIDGGRIGATGERHHLDARKTSQNHLQIDLEIIMGRDKKLTKEIWRGRE
jgi:hypothetical protein